MGMEDKVIDRVITVVIVASLLGGGLASTVLTAFTNLSGAGLALGVLFATVLPLVFAVWVYKVVKKSMG